MAQKRSRTRLGLVGCAAVAAALSLVFAGVSNGADASLAAAQKALKSGKPEFAVNTLTAALAGPGLKGGDIARAYYLRGVAHSKAGNKTAAMADFNHALWLKGLSDTERTEAIAARAKLYQQAGVAETAEPPAPEVAVVAAPTKPAAAPKVVTRKIVAAVEEPAADGAEIPPNAVEIPVSVEAAVAETSTWGSKPVAEKASNGKKMKGAAELTVAEQPAEPAVAPEELPWKNAAAPQAAKTMAVSQDTPVDSMFGSLFGVASTSPTPAAVSAPAPEPAPEQVASTAPAAAPAPKPSVKPSKGTVFLQVASLRSPKEADALAAKLTAEQAKVLGGVGTRVKSVVLGNMGTFYAVHVGPVATAAAGEGLCKKLRGNGVDCFIATP